MSLIRGIRSGIFVNLDNLDKEQQGQQVAEEKPKEKPIKRKNNDVKRVNYPTGVY